MKNIKTFESFVNEDYLSIGNTVKVTYPNHKDVDKIFNSYLMTRTDPYTTLRVWRTVSESIRRNGIITLPQK